MRNYVKWTIVLVVSAIWAAPALSQQAVLPDATTAKLLLLRQKSVQKELEIGDDLAKKIIAFTNEESEAFGKALELAEGKRKKAIDDLEEKNKKFITDTLNAKQIKHLDQIYMQVTPLQHLNTPEIAKTLNLSAEQQKMFKDLQTEAHKELTELFSSTDSKGRNEKLAKLREKTRTKIRGILTEKQLAQAQEIVGPQFTGELVFEEFDAKKDK